MKTSSPEPVIPRRHWHLLGGFSLLAAAAALIDIMLAYAYWSPRGLGFRQILGAAATWVIGSEPVQPSAEMIIGAGVEFSLYALGTLLVYFVLTRLLRRDRYPLPLVGVAMGIVVYLLLFQGLVPAITYPYIPNHSAGWVSACVSVHTLLIGPILTFGVSWLCQGTSSRRRVAGKSAPASRSAVGKPFLAEAGGLDSNEIKARLPPS